MRRGPWLFRAIALAPATLLWLAPAARGQPEAPGVLDAPITADDQVEAFLADHNLREVMAAQLRARLSSASAADRLALAERLGAIYVQLMAQARTPEALQRLELHGRALLDAVPEAEAYGLKLDLAKARYLSAEEVVENQILRLASPAQAQDAERALRSVLSTFDQVAQASHRRVEVLERQEERGRLEADPEAREALAEGRRLRSLAHYYAGWTRYYLSVLASSPALAQESLVDFGWLLSALPGQAPTIDRLPRSLLKYEHIARAAIGVALASAQRGEHVEAVRWLEAVESAEDVPSQVRDQVFLRRVLVFCEARRWADLTWQVERIQRQRTQGDEPGRLTIREARLLAIGTLEAARQGGGPADRAGVVEQLTQIALADLVHAGEVGHVLDLVQRYGTAPMGQEGFIVAYVRGLQTYDQARTAHQAQAGESGAASPTQDPALVNAYREASNLLQAALDAPDGTRFTRERAQCGIMMGFALFYAGDHEAAADALEAVAQSAQDPRQSEEALWVAIVALDEGVEAGRPSLTERRDRVALMFLERHPASPRAAELLVRRAGSGLVDDDQAVQILLSVERGSPLYHAARRHASGLLYKLYRRSTGAERDFAVVRFADVAQEVLRLDLEAMETSRGPESLEAATFVVLRGRQLLDALLGASAPDLDRAQDVLEIVESTIASAAGEATPEVREELLYRRVQIALARGDDAEVDRRLTELRAMNGTLARTADRLMYSRAARTWALTPQDPALARAVVAAGQRVIAQYPAPPEAFADPTVAPLYSGVAEAAAVVWRTAPDEVTFRDIAVRLDTALMRHGRASAPSLKRLGELAEAAGDIPAALEAWQALLAGLNPGRPEWFEARFEAIRVQSLLDPAAARLAMDQHVVLYPDYGPDPWGEKLRDLDRQLPGAGGGR